MTKLDPLDVPLLGHLGLLDSLNHALTSAGAEARRITHEPERAEAVEELRRALRRADAVSALARDALRAGATREQQVGLTNIEPRDREDWQRRHREAVWTSEEAGVLRRIEDSA